ncbi:RHS repeat-associated core domain-containing protein [Bacteroides sp.]|nr:RHS repeat-associated core domain-containing protein [Bacteroides sp.]
MWRKLPGCDAVRYVYDKADRLIFVQDGNLKGQGRWRFTIPDALGRTVLSGLCSEPLPVDGSAVEAEFTGSGSYKGYAVKVGGTVRALSGSRLLTVNYYDNYDFLGKNGFPAYAYDSSMESSGYGTKSDARGMLTGSVTGLAGDGAGQLYSVVYYDRRSRPVQRQGSNSLGGKETEYTAYNFTGQPTRLRHVHTAQGKAVRTEVRTYSYDHAGRLLTVKHKLDALGEVTLVNNVYDDLGRLQSKSLHGSAVNKQTYTYNIRGWLTGVSGSKFTQNLYYNTGNGVVKYNGSISSMTWKSGNESTVRGYKFTYDGLDRMLNATYGETASISTNANRFSENVTGYDKNGNIKSLQRYGQTGASAYGLLDNLTYTLTGNQLSCVEDAVSTAAYGTNTAFVNGASVAGEYAYDANGNLTKDLNKGITDIQYNVLNLPSTVSFSDGSTITYTYGADGTKLRTVHKIGSTTTTTDYCGNVIYENGTQKLLLTEEGYINLTGTQQYHYYLKDHQGNNRVVINQSGTVEETNHYYPFGGVFGTAGNTQPYKYNGKELDTKKGLNWYDYGARHYDAALGRFTTNDPLAEKYYSMSPYTYCADNPVKFIDPNGMEYAPGDLFKTKRAAAKDWGMYYNGASIIRKREMGSSIYEVKQKGKLKGYSYSAANEGEHSVSISLPPNGERFVGSIHSHGDADAEHINNKFSKADIKYIEKTKENGYLATPSGDLLEYNPYSKKTSIVTSDLPSDPKDPKRKNNINPKDIPAEKGKQRMKELLQKPDLNIPVSQREHIHWVF